MQIHVEPAEGVPIYQQIVDQVKRLVAAGRLAPGEELPPIRVLAEQLLVNPNTVARAYRELELAGLVAKRRTSGTYVSGGAAPMDLADRLALLAEPVDQLLTQARQLDVATEELLEYLAERAAAADERSSREREEAGR
jgi:GntR family transcriptional regulator